MSLHDKEIRVLRFMQDYGDNLVAGIAAEDFCKQPMVGMNHPAWIIAHLAVAADAHATEVGAAAELEEWHGRFGFNSPLSTDPGDYPSKAELLEAWHAANARYIAAVESATPEQLSTETRGPLVKAFPTVGDFLAFSLTGHVSLHLGQLSAWRRAMGMKRLF